MRTRWMMSTFFAVAVTALSVSAQDAGHQHAWTYTGEDGPEHWGDLKTEYSACKVGREQSPIDIRNPKIADLPAIHFDYKRSPLKIIDNGHTIQVNYAPGSFIEVGDKRYELKQFHFHHPSEERIEGKPSSMVVHLVHADSDGKLAVFAVLLKEGNASAIIQEIWARLPKTTGTEQDVPGVQIDASALLPKNAAYYTFAGSLTTPPCSEGVRWFVLKAATEVSPEQINAFARIYPNNARPVQPLNGRVVSASE